MKRKAKTKKQTTTQLLKQFSDELYDLRQENIGLRGGLAALQKSLERAQRALGGSVWRDADGNERWIVTLSTSHLRNILEMPNIRYATENNINLELARRAKDADWRKREEVKPIKLAGYPGVALNGGEVEMIRALRNAGLRVLS